MFSVAADGHTYWHGIATTTTRAGLADLATLQRISCGQKLSAALHDRLHPGAILTTPDLPLTPDSRSGKDFVVVTTETS